MNPNRLAFIFNVINLIAIYIVSFIYDTSYGVNMEDQDERYRRKI